MNATPRQIGPYTITREIGRGGMGVVYLARDDRLDRDVAIKAMPEELAADPVRLERFEREAKTLATLNHPSVAGIYGVEEQDGRKYLILEFVEGETLGERLDRGPIRVDEAIEIAIGIAAGIEAAHEAGIIHRDLKPDNIKITPEGKVKVLDFGLAKAEEASTSTVQADSPTVMSRHSPTIPGAILGTAACMILVEARGRNVDRRTDIWSFRIIGGGRVCRRHRELVRGVPRPTRADRWIAPRVLDNNRHNSSSRGDWIRWRRPCSTVWYTQA